MVHIYESFLYIIILAGLKWTRSRSASRLLHCEYRGRIHQHTYLLRPGYAQFTVSLFFLTLDLRILPRRPPPSPPLLKFLDPPLKRLYCKQGQLDCYVGGSPDYTKVSWYIRWIGAIVDGIFTTTEKDKKDVPIYLMIYR